MFELLFTPLISHSLIRFSVILFIYSWVWLFMYGNVHVFIPIFVNSFIVSFIYIFMITVLMNSSDLYCRCAKGFCWVKQRQWHHLVRHLSNQKHADLRIVWDRNSASPLFVTASDRCCCSNSWVRPRIVVMILITEHLCPSLALSPLSSHAASSTSSSPPPPAFAWGVDHQNDQCVP